MGVPKTSVDESKVQSSCNEGWIPGVVEATNVTKTMKSTIFVRPNLKMFLLGAVVLLVVQHLISGGLSRASGLVRPVSRQASYAAENDVEKLIEQSREKPSSALFLRISRCYEAQHDYRKALTFLRKAETIAQTEESGE
jgi:hypothetical protein